MAWSQQSGSWSALSGGLAQEYQTQQEPVEPPIQFRRYLVPESEIGSSLQQGFEPIRRERFEQMLAAINAQVATAQPLARITRARYSARLEADHLVEGQAEARACAIRHFCGRLDSLALPARDLSAPLGRRWFAGRHIGKQC